MPPLDEAVLDRLNSMDKKLEKVADAITTLARVEERQVHQREDLGRAWAEIRKLNSRMTEAERNIGNNKNVLGLGGKFWWPIYGGVVATTFGLIGWYLHGAVPG